MAVSLSSISFSCGHAATGSRDPRASLSCKTKVFIGLKPQSAGAFCRLKPNVNADFFHRVHQCISLRNSNKKYARPRISMMPIGTPRVPYRTPGEGTWQWVDLWNALYRERVIFIGQHIDEEFSNQVLATMLYLDSMDDSKKLHLYINGPGGDDLFSTLDLIPGDKIEFLLIIAPVKESYVLACMAFKAAENLNVPLKVCIIWPHGSSVKISSYSITELEPWKNYIDVVEVKSPFSGSWWEMCNLSSNGVILVRPDEHIAWSAESNKFEDSACELERVFSLILGRTF